MNGSRPARASGRCRWPRTRTPSLHRSICSVLIPGSRVTSLPMDQRDDHYEAWLERSGKVRASLERPPVVAQGAKLPWIETRQDARVQMLIGAATGFPTQGTALLRAEIPAGWHTGRHVHGEEAIHFLSGSGFSMVAGARYDWKAGTTVHVPFRAEHQHVNTGAEPAQYISAVTHDLDLATNIGGIEQLGEKGPDDGSLARRYPAETSQLAADGRRIALHLEDAIDERKLRLEGQAHHKEGKGAHRHGGIWILMGGSESRSKETNGFRAKAAAITHIFEEAPRTRSHRH